MWDWYMHDGFFGGGFFMFFFWIAVIALIVWGVVSLTKKNNINSGGSTFKREPLDIARERFAKGEISKEEFEAIKKALQ